MTDVVYLVFTKIKFWCYIYLKKVSEAKICIPLSDFNFDVLTSEEIYDIAKVYIF